MCFPTTSIGPDPHAVDISPIKDHYISGVLGRVRQLDLV